MSVVSGGRLSEARERRLGLKCAVAMGALLAAMPTQGAFAASRIEGDLFAGLDKLSDAELAQNRGGFAVGNLVVSFGFSIKTSITGPLIKPVTVTTNFTVSTPGQLTNLGTQISGAVTRDLQKAGLVDDGNPNTPTLGEQISSNVNDAVSGIGIKSGNANHSSTDHSNVGSSAAPVSTPPLTLADSGKTSVTAPTNVPTTGGTSTPSLVATLPKDPASPAKVVPLSNPPSMDDIVPIVASSNTAQGNSSGNKPVQSISAPDVAPQQLASAPSKPSAPASSNAAPPQIVSVPRQPSAPEPAGAPQQVASAPSEPSAPTPVSTPQQVASAPDNPSSSWPAKARVAASDYPKQVTEPSKPARSSGSENNNDSAVSDSIVPAMPEPKKPQHEFVATVDDNDGSISLTNGAGTDVLLKTLTGRLAVVQNTNNDVTISNQYSANFVIENYHDIARAAHLVNQLTGVTQQMIVMHGLAGR